MPLYRYRAITAEGEMIDGELEARDSATAIQRIEGLGHMPIDASEIEAGTRGSSSGGLLAWRGVSRQNITLFTRELAMLLKSGLTLEQGLAVLAEDSGEAAAFQRIVAQVLDDVRGGESFHEALAKHPRAFPPVYVNMVNAAEASGTLEPVLDRLADYRERSEKLRQRLIGAMLYPMILIVASILSVLLLLVFVVPQFEQVFKDAGAALPVMTQIVVESARWLKANALFHGIALLAALLLARQALRTPGPRAAFDRFLLTAPLLGPLFRQIVTARFCRTFGTLLSNGVELPLSLSLSRDVVGNSAAAAAIDDVAAAVRQGRSFAETLAGARIVPAMAVQMMRVGEETGRLWPTALHIADIFETKLETNIQRLFIFLQPALVGGVGLLIGGIIASILMAVVSINDLAF